MGTDCDGEGKQRSGGLAVLWDSTLEVEITSMSRNHVDMIIQENGRGQAWRINCFYVLEQKEKLGGYANTWSNNQVGEANIQERLDRAVATIDWKEAFPKAVVKHLQRYR
ncbi:hypothetical protein Ahy_A10g049901 [Arachis hypogaea]|uniref:Uncharacterized protein n=1 Tax=Arachis hypogaea TaxID=3818 RepID=A0A445B850_ARAHY|nr:hypothetical protein Ahy_A10g049901 [Arachis hypogaea]